MIEITTEMFERALNELTATPSGQIVFAVLKQRCKWDETYLASDNPTVSHFYAVERGVYGSFRKCIKPEYLKKIEFDYTAKGEPHDGSTGGHAGAGKRKPRVLGAGSISGQRMGRKD